MTRTRADGSVALADLRLATYLLTVAAPGYRGASQEVTIERGSETTTIEIRLQPVPATLSGTVVHTDSGSPLAGVRVALGEWNTVTDDQGRYELTDLQPGVFPLQVLADGFSAYEATIVIDPGSQRAHDVRLAPARGMLLIRVVDAVTGEPIEGAAIACAADDDLPCADYDLLVPLKRSSVYGAIRKLVADPKPKDAWQHSGLHFFSFALRSTNGGHHNGDVSGTLPEPPVAVFAMHPHESDPVSAVVVSPSRNGGSPEISDLRQSENGKLVDSDAGGSA